LHSAHRLDETRGDVIPISAALSASFPHLAEIEHESPSPSLTTVSQFQAEEELNQGDRLMHQGQFAAATVHYRRAIAANPNWAIAHQKLADALEQQGLIDEAVVHYRQAVALNTASSAAIAPVSFHGSSTKESSAPETFLSAEAESYLQQATDACQQQQWHQAIAHCKSLLIIHPDVAIAYKLWGNALQALGEIDQAREKYQQALHAQPNYAEVYANLGSLYAQQECWDIAIQHYQQAIAIKPDFAGAYRNLAKVWTRQGNTRLATECWYQALRLEPNDATLTQYLTLGNELLQQGQLPQAEICYRRVIELDEAFAGGHLNLAEALAQQGQWQDAVKHYRQVIRLSDSGQVTRLTTPPSLSPSTRERSDAQCYHQAKHYAQQQEWEQVTATIYQGLQHLEPELSQLYELLGDALRASGNSDAAIQCYRKLAVLQPQSAEALANLGSLYAQQQQWQLAITTYQRAIAIKPDFAGVYRNLARVWTQVGNAEAAAECWYQALSIAPNWATAEEHFNLGNTLVNQNKLDWALTCYQQAATLNPSLTQTYYNAAAVLSQQERYDEAIAYYQHVIQQVPTHADAYDQLGQLSAQQNHWEAATTYYQQIITLEPDQTRGYRGLCESLVQQNRFIEAIPVYQKLVELLPNEWRVHHELGDALLQVERWLDAVTAFRRAINLNPNFFWSYNNLGDALMHLKQWSDAAAIYQRAIALQSDFHWSHYNLGEALAKLNEWDAAIDSYRHALKLRPDLSLAHDKLREALQQRIRLCSDEILQSHYQEIKLNPDNVQAYYKALETRPKDAQLYIKLGQALVKQNQLDQAITFYNIALKIDCDYTEAHVSLGEALEKKGRNHQAIQSYQRALTLQPNLDNVQVRLNALLTANDTNTNHVSLKRVTQETILGDRPLSPTQTQSALHSCTLAHKPVAFSEDAASATVATVSQIKGWPARESLLLRSSTIDASIYPQFEFRRHLAPDAHINIISQGGIWLEANQSMLITADGLQVGDGSTAASNISLAQFQPREYVDGNVAVLSSKEPNATINWMFEMVAKIELLKICGINIASIDRFIVHPCRNESDKAWLADLGIEPHKIEGMSSLQITAKTVFAPSKFLQPVILSNWVCEVLKRKLVNIEQIDRRSRPQKLYLKQSHPDYHILNESELVALLSRFGFQSVDFSSKSLIEKVTYMAFAVSVISIQSPELATGCCCNIGTNLIEIFPTDDFENTYWVMSNLCSLNHYYISAKQAESPQHAAQPTTGKKQIWVDLKQISLLLQKIDSNYQLLGAEGELVCQN
jgi:tetratricopeptide (TPR) repeat protein